MNSSKKWCIIFLIEFLFLTLIIISIVVVVDPFFHYHKPISFLQYPIDNERYQNDGIVKHFDYDAIITGTSMTENFKTSEVDELFNVTSIKVPFSGATFNEINQNLERAIYSNKNIKCVIRAIDLDYLIKDKDELKYAYSYYPWYLYDNNIFNDVKYVLNKEILFKTIDNVIEYTKDGNLTTNFDDYANWNSGYKFGKNVLDSLYDRKEKTKEKYDITNNEVTLIKGNVNQNILQIVKENPTIQFYFYYSPYSIYYWDKLNNDGVLEKYIKAEKITTELLLNCENVKLFSFWNQMDLITNLENYKDIYHYSEMINTQILYWMKEEKDLLTKENYKEYYDKILNILSNFNYDEFFK